MPNMRPLDWIERVSVGLTVLGLAGSIYTKQVVYATLPLGAYIPISYLKRQKIESTLENNRQELDKKNREIDAVLDTINKRFLETASVENFNTSNNQFSTISHNLAQFKESQNKAKLESDQVNAKQDLRISEEEQKLEKIKEEIQQLIEKFNKKFRENQEVFIANSQELRKINQQQNLEIDSQKSQLNNLVEESRINKERIEDIESQINLSNLVERLETLEIEIVTINSNLLSKVNLEDINQFQTNLSNLKDSVDEILLWREEQDLNLSNLSVKEGQLSQKLDDLEIRQQKNDSNLSSESKLLTESINKLKQRLQNSVSIALLNNRESNINSKLKGITENLGQNISGLKSEIVSVQEHIRDLEKQSTEQVEILHQQSSQHQEQYNNIQQQLIGLESEISNNHNQEINSFKFEVENLNSQIQKFPYYHIIQGRRESRYEFLEALREVKEHLILVCPWVKEYALQGEAKSLIKNALERGIRLDIDWGFLGDVKNDRTKLTRDNLIRIKPDSYNGIIYFENLMQDYPNQISLKLLGTHEKYLIQDRKMAMLGSHNFLGSGDSSSEREIGIKTNDLNIIKSLIENHENTSRTRINNVNFTSKMNIYHSTKEENYIIKNDAINHLLEEELYYLENEKERIKYLEEREYIDKEDIRYDEEPPVIRERMIYLGLDIPFEELSEEDEEPSEEELFNERLYYEAQENIRVRTENLEAINDYSNRIEKEYSNMIGETIYDDWYYQDPNYRGWYY